jgi:hypothetical protein
MRGLTRDTSLFQTPKKKFDFPALETFPRTPFKIPRQANRGRFCEVCDTLAPGFGGVPSPKKPNRRERGGINFWDSYFEACVRAYGPQLQTHPIARGEKPGAGGSRPAPAAPLRGPKHFVSLFETLRFRSRRREGRPGAAMDADMGTGSIIC